MSNILKKLWFEDVNAPVLFINKTAMRIRGGILLCIPILVSFSLYDALFMGNYVVDTNTLVDTYETNWDDQIIYTAEVVKRVNDYTIQTYLLLFALFEFIAGMFVSTSRFAPLIILSTFLARNKPIVWTPLIPKRFAWGLGISMILVCLIFFNPDTFAGYFNALLNSEILPRTHNYIPYQIPIILIWVCMSFMWMETILGICPGCKIHSFLVFIKVLDKIEEHKTFIK